jgi:3-oxoadipate enol-lactonase
MAEITEINGSPIWWELSGSGPTVVQVGGAVSAHEGYETVTPVMSEHFEVLDYDHRGYGASARPVQRYDAQTWCDDLVALIDHLGRDRVHVHGGSMGSFIAIEFALRHPGRVERLVLGAGAVARCDGMGISHFRVWQHLARAYGTDSRELAEELVNKAFSRRFIDEHGLDELAAGMRESASRNVSTHVFLDACQLMIDADVVDSLPDLHCPTLVMVGSEDVLTPLRAGPAGVGAVDVAARIPNAQLVVFEGSGHGHYVEQPEESNRAILEFLT